MRLQQLRYIHEVARNNLNLSQAAEVLFTSQPGISKQIKSLEDELGVQIFVRHGKRVIAVTEPGKVILRIAERVLQDVASLKQASEEFTREDIGGLTIATTHTQARYALPPVIKRFRDRYPRVKLTLHQGNPTQISELTTSGEADFAIATEAIERYDELVMLPCYQWNRCVVVPARHPLARVKPLTLEAVARYPIVTYDFAFANRSLVEKAFEQRGLAPRVVLSALDADVIKTYVELGLGVGIMASMAFDAKRDRGLRGLDAAHLFESSTTRLGIKRGAWLRRYAYEFIEMFAPQLPRSVVEPSVMGAEGSSYEL